MRAVSPQWLDVRMTRQEESPRIVAVTREIAANSERIFELIADPAQQPRWDGNENLQEAAPGQRVRAVGDVFAMRLTTGSVRENHVVDFAEGRRIAWRPSEVGQPPPGHLWAWDSGAAGPFANTGDPHLRLDRPNGRAAASSRPGDHSREIAGLARSARRPGTRMLNASGPGSNVAELAYEIHIRPTRGDARCGRGVGAVRRLRLGAFVPARAADVSAAM